MLNDKLKGHLWCAALLVAVFLTSIPAGAYAQEKKAESSVAELYRLGAGDRLAITVLGEEDLSGEFEVEGSGSVSYPLLGEIKVGGKSLREVEKLLSDQLADGYLVDPKLSVEVTNFRPFFIMGEINKPGSYPYVNALTVLNAVALAGGYTHRAKEGEVIIHRNVKGELHKFRAKENIKVLPGDTLRVEERLF